MRFNQKLTVMAFAASAVVANLSAQASSVDVKVIGTIIPGACTPTLAGGGTIDYGNIGASELSQTAYTALDEKPVPFTISCTAPTKVAIRGVDNKSSSVVPGILSALSGGRTDVYNFGLGTVSGSNVGGYSMLMKQGTFTADGVSVVAIGSVDSGTSWVGTTLGAVQNVATNLRSWSTTNNGVPIAFTTLTGTFAVQAVLNKGSDLPLTNDVPLDGSATLELIYL